MSLTREQVDVLLKPIKPSRIFSANGQSHVPAYDVAAHLTRIFGFGGWDKQTSEELIFEEPTKTAAGKPAWTVAYRCHARLTIKDPDGLPVAFWEDAACGGSTQPQRWEAHDMALKSAVSYALKRCAAFGLGDQFGLGLYAKGSTGGLIGKTLVTPGTTSTRGAAPDLESHIPVPQSLGLEEGQ